MSASPDSPALPTGTVTFLLTDVEGSTTSWEAEPEAMARAVAQHYEVLGDVVAAHGGVRPVEQGEGDSIVAAFTHPSDAVLAALEAQHRLAAHEWPTAAALKVRMAVHTGEARLRDEGNYSGNAVIRTARLRAIGHGGQILVSSATRDLVVDELGKDVLIVDLSVHRLKDLSRPERVWQVGHADLDAEFPPLRSLDVVPNNLPVSLSSFIGGFNAVDTVARLTLDNRLVTLTGSGGAGKTRLAQQVAAEIADAFPDGVWWIDLVSVDDPDLIPSAISRAALLPEDRADRLGGVGRRLAGKRALIVLDNCEHLLDGCADVASALLRACPELTLLTTSRAPLSLPGELTWRVPPLALPDPARQDEPAESLARYDAIRLFTDRASRAHQDFRLTDTNATAVAEICARLEGIPLALELAAAKCRVLTVAQILDGLTDAIGLLASTRRGVSARHQTIDASIRWSHSLLSDEQQILLRRLAQLAGPFTLDAAVAVASDDQLSSAAVFGLLESLVDQSLVQMQESAGDARYRVLETVKQFARRELEAAGELDDVAARHAEYFAQRALGLWPFFGANMGELLDQADADFDDLRLMLSHLARHASPERHATVAMACLPGMAVRHLAEAAALGDQVASRVDELSILGGKLQLQLALVDPTMPKHVELGVAAAAATEDPELQAHAAYWGAWSESSADPTPEAIRAFEDARQGLVRLGEDHFSRAHWQVAGMERAVGRYEDALRHWELARTETVCKRCSVEVWSEGALLALERGELPEAQVALDRALALAREVRDASFQCQVWLTATEVAVYAGKDWSAEEVEADLRHGLAIGHPLLIGFASEACGLAHLVAGRLAQADESFVRAIHLLDDTWTKRSEARLRRAAIRQALGDRDGAAAIVAGLRGDAARWDAGPWLLGQIDHRTAALALDAGDVSAADDLAHRALSDAWLGPWRPLVVDALELLVSIAVARESHVEAGRLYGAASTQRDAISFRFSIEPERSRLARDLSVAREELGDAAFEAACDEGRRLSLDEAVAYARRARGERKRPSHGWDGLTPTERQVAELAVSGLTNAGIAERLFVGRETVKTHLSSVYAKVGVANRTQLVADAARRGISP